MTYVAPGCLCMNDSLDQAARQSLHRSYRTLLCRESRVAPRLEFNENLLIANGDADEWCGLASCEAGLETSV